ncbi:MAG TPA: hypothetical protein VLW85_15590 [Myxococcales bacterium]|nr:hypothetical protein [Myxococcales bacterium]
MARKKLAPIEVGYQAFAVGSEEEFGAVRSVEEGLLLVYIEDKGDTVIPLSAVVEVIEGKVIVDISKLEPELREAIAAAHRDEDYP